MAEQPMMVGITVISHKQEHILKAGEAFVRVATGLVLDGINVSVNFAVPEEVSDAAGEDGSSR